MSSSEEKKSHLRLVLHGDFVVVSILVERLLDEAIIQLIGDELFDLVDRKGRKQLILNFASVKYLSSGALGKFISLNKKIKENAGRLVLCSIGKDIYEVFKITKLNKFFEIAGDDLEALRMVGAG